jgi:hypothetical protein
VGLRAAGWDRAHELRHRPAAHLLVRDVPELPVLAGRVSRLVRQAHDPPLGSVAGVAGLERQHGHQYELFGALVLHLVALARCDEDPAFGLELVPRAVQGDRPRARDCEQKLFARAAAVGLREPRSEADHALLERVAAEFRPDGDPRRGGVPVDLASLGRGLVGHMAAHRLTGPRVWGGSRRGEP